MKYSAILVFVMAWIVMISAHAMAGEPAGRWRGDWTSHTSGHHGPMRAVIHQRPDGNYDARFVGRFALVIPFTYKVTMIPVAADECGTTLAASKRLPLLGIYNMTASVSGGQFTANYNSRKDQGVFQMRR